MGTDANRLFERSIVRGSGADQGKNCSVELLGLAIYGDYKHGYRLPCIDIPSQMVVVVTNDLMKVKTLQTMKWRLLVARLGQCHAHGNDRLHMRMVVWCLRSMKLASSLSAMESTARLLERHLEGEATSAELTEEWARLDNLVGPPSVLSWNLFTPEERALIGACRDLLKMDTDITAVNAATFAAQLALNEIKIKHIATPSECTVPGCSCRENQDPFERAAMDWLERYFDAWHKTAVDEGEAIPEEQEREYAEFAAQLDQILAEGGK